MDINENDIYFWSSVLVLCEFPCMFFHISLHAHLFQVKKAVKGVENVFALLTAVVASKAKKMWAY